MSTKHNCHCWAFFEQQGEIFYLEIFKGENSNYHKNNFIAIFKRQKLKCFYFKQIIFFRSFLFFIAQKHLKKKKTVAQIFPSSFFSQSEFVGYMTFLCMTIYPLTLDRYFMDSHFRHCHHSYLHFIQLHL